MCICAVKHFKDVGWVGVKNRDRNYKPTVHIKQSFRGGIERLYIWDEKTKYTEGLNEFGIGIISAAVATKKDEKEVANAAGEESFFSPDGKKIRTALLEKTLEKVISKVIELEVPGNTFCFTKDECWLIEGAFTDEEMTDYQFKKQKIKKDETCVRTNHGIMLGFAGYQDGPDADEDEKASRLSSETRLKKTEDAIKKVKVAGDMLNCISDDSSDKNPQLNPLRRSETHGSTILVTTGQIMLVPSTLTLSYRPIWSEIEFNFNRLDGETRKTQFEVISKKKLASFNEFIVR